MNRLNFEFALLSRISQQALLFSYSRERINGTLLIDIVGLPSSKPWRSRQGRVVQQIEADVTDILSQRACRKYSFHMASPALRAEEVHENLTKLATAGVVNLTRFVVVDLLFTARELTLERPATKRNGSNGRSST